MIQALLAGVASIKAQQTRMNVIGNNLANINTTAFKGQDVQFNDLIAQQWTGATGPTKSGGGTNGIQTGLGVRVSATTTDMSQGSLSATANPSDLAIQGNGFFMVSDGQKISYTRDGSFTIDSAGNLVNSSNGEELVGWTADQDGNIDTTKQLTTANSLKIPIGVLDAAQATSTVTIAGDLAASGTDANSTGTVTTTVYDAQGNAHDVTIQFHNPTTQIGATPPPPGGAVSQWSWTAYSGDTATGTSIGSSDDPGNGPIYFDNNGNPLFAAGTALDINVPPVGTGTATKVSLDMGAVSELGSTTQVAVTTQNGFPPGSLQNYAIGQDGTIVGNFTNGLTKVLGQVALASFTNPAGLTSLGANMFTVSSNSGSPVVGTANTGSRGSINSGFLEQSNVDLSTNLTNLIITQRGFEANTKIVSTVDEMLQDIMQMKH
ncbi:MAG TPA: flagellar hook protein FlgE [Fimbriimonas sp.]|nr:flagellar hook protein FlgE [Fimbriimonas sp.]